jgi:hypothetical protein
MIVEKQIESRLAGESEVLGENLPQRHFCPSQNPTWPDPALNPGRRGGKPATNRMSNGAASCDDLTVVQILCFSTLSNVLFLPKTSSCLYFKTQGFDDWILQSIELVGKRVFKYKQDGVLDKKRTMDNAQKHNICIIYKNNTKLQKLSIWYKFQYFPPIPVHDTFDQYVKNVNYNIHFSSYSWTYWRLINTINIYRMSQRLRERIWAFVCAAWSSQRVIWRLTLCWCLQYLPVVLQVHTTIMHTNKH